jgi:hypothetical protein
MSIVKDCTATFYYSDGDDEVDTNLGWLTKSLHENPMWLMFDNKFHPKEILTINLSKIYRIKIKPWNTEVEIEG